MDETSAYVVQREGSWVDIVVEQAINPTLAVPRVAVDRPGENVVRDLLPVAQREQTRRVVRVQEATPHNGNRDTDAARRVCRAASVKRVHVSRAPSVQRRLWSAS